MSSTPDTGQSGAGTARCGALTPRHWRDRRTDDQRREDPAQTCSLPPEHAGDWHKGGGKMWSAQR